MILVVHNGTNNHTYKQRTTILHATTCCASERKRSRQAHSIPVVGSGATVGVEASGWRCPLVRVSTASPTLFLVLNKNMYTFETTIFPCNCFMHVMNLATLFGSVLCWRLLSAHPFRNDEPSYTIRQCLVLVLAVMNRATLFGSVSCWRL